jgi:hypothetical protein
MRFRSSIGACLLAVLTGASVGAVEAARPGASLMGAAADARLEKAAAEGRSTVTLLIAAKPGANSQVAAGLAKLGAVVRYREDSIGYLRVRMPIDKVSAVSKLAGVQSVDVDEVIPIPDVRPDGAVAPTPQTPPGASTPNNNPYMPIGDTGASQFMAAHPTWDGRGVTIGIVDTGVTLDHPSLLTTTTSEAKIIDWVTATDPFDDGDPTWVDMSALVSGATFAFNSQTYTAPYAGTFRIGVFNERDERLGGEVGRDVNRDGNPTGSSGLFAVLWDTVTGVVWVDTNQNLNFADDMPMRDYKVNRDINYFGTDNPATAIAERMPFVVQTDLKNIVVNIGIVSGAHGSHVAGIAAANQLFGGAMSGGAPGAKIVSARACLFIAGCTAHALIEGMIFVAKQSNVDVINMSIGGLPALNDGNNTRATLYNRLIEQYNVQMFISSGNEGPGLNTAGDPSVATRVMSVGAYVSNATLQSNYGSDSAFVDNLNTFTSRGPREDGGFKPQLVAPGSAISTTPMWQDGGPVPGTYTLPPGYQMFNGTSMASPQAAAVGALLISAAKSFGAQRQPAQMRQALNSTARLLDTSRIQVYAQGNGLISAGAAWELLKTNIKLSEISASVPVTTVISQFLATPHVGTGIYDREDVVLNVPYTRTYTFVRMKGGAKAITYNASWLGNDGTFSSGNSVSLALNKPVQYTVNINPQSYGIHSAILQLDDPATAGVDFQTMNVVVVPETFSAGNNYSIAHTGSIGRNQAESVFYDVPAGVAALRVDFSGPSATPGTGQARFLRYHPYGVYVESSNNSLTCYLPPVAGGGCPGGGPASRTTSLPLSGVWEVTVDARRTSDVASAPYSLTATILGTLVSPNPDLIAQATVGIPVARSYTLTNVYGPFTGRAIGTTLGSARLETPTIANLQQLQFPVVVTAGSTSLRATIGSPTDTSADLDLFVFNCTTEPCVLAGQAATSSSEESVTFADPAAGNWVVLVDGFSVPAGTTDFKYVDVFVNSAFGSVSITDANALRPAGSSWTVPGSVTANAVPAEGRALLGNVQVRTDTNVLVGSGDVIVQSVVAP